MNSRWTIYRMIDRQQLNAAKQQYEVDLAEYKANKKKNPDLEKPSEPPLQLLFIPLPIVKDQNGKMILIHTFY